MYIVMTVMSVIYPTHDESCHLNMFSDGFIIFSIHIFKYTWIFICNTSDMQQEWTTEVQLQCFFYFYMALKLYSQASWNSFTREHTEDGLNI